MDKIQRATEIHRSMTPHQMALYIVDIDEICTRAAIRINELLKERNATGVAIDSATRGIIPEQHPMLSRLQMIANMAKRITELQDALELAEEAVRAKHVPDIAKMVVPDGWQQQVFELCNDVMMSRLPMTEAMTNCMYQSTGDRNKYPNAADWLARAAISAAPKLGGE